MEDWEYQMDHLVDAYLQYQQYINEEMQCNPPQPDEPSNAIEIEIIDVFYKFFLPSAQY